MMRHSCEWCSGRKARRSRRASALDYLRLHRNIPTKTAADDLGLNRTTVHEWRKEAEARGCILIRTRDGRAGWDRHLRALSVATPGAPVYPLGTLWTDTATARVA